MIVEGLLELVKGVLIGFLSLLPQPNINFESNSIVDSFLDILESVAYVVPIGDFLLILTIWFGLYTFFIGWKALQRVWDALPFI